MEAVNLISSSKYSEKQIVSLSKSWNLKCRAATYTASYRATSL